MNDILLGKLIVWYKNSLKGNANELSEVKSPHLFLNTSCNVVWTGWCLLALHYTLLLQGLMMEVSKESSDEEEEEEDEDHYDMEEDTST